MTKSGTIPKNDWALPQREAVAAPLSIPLAVPRQAGLEDGPLTETRMEALGRAMSATLNNPPQNVVGLGEQSDDPVVAPRPAAKSISHLISEPRMEPSSIVPPAPEVNAKAETRRTRTTGMQQTAKSESKPEIKAANPVTNTAAKSARKPAARVTAPVTPSGKLKSPRTALVKSAGGRKLATGKGDGVPVEAVPAQALAAVALFKRIPATAIAAAVGIPATTVEAYFEGRPVSIRAATKRALAEFLGVDLKNARMRDNQVHFFHMDAMALFSSEVLFEAQLRALGMLLRESRAAAVGFPVFGALKRATLPAVHVVQNNYVRAIFLGAKRATYHARFQPDMLLACTWARGAESASTANIFQKGIAARVLNADMTPIEFDEIFQGKHALAWVDVEQTARVHQVTKQEIILWIESVGVNRAGNYHRPNLRVIEAAVAGLEFAPTAGAANTTSSAPLAALAEEN